MGALSSPAIENRIPTTIHTNHWLIDEQSPVQKASSSDGLLYGYVRISRILSAIAIAPDEDSNVEGSFESQIRRSEHEQLPRERLIPAVAATDPLENYVSIIHEMLGPEPLNPPDSINKPYYVSELPSRLELSDLNYLENKGALCLPTAPSRQQLLKSYILWVHPELPVLDLDAFLGIIAGNDGKNRISLLLFHAVMFAASAFVDISHIQDMGYTSRKVARDVLLRRVKVRGQPIQVLQNDVDSLEDQT